CQTETEEKPQNEFRMSELLDTLLDRHPRIALRIDTSSGSRLGHLFCGIGAECRHGQDAYKRNDSDHRDCASRPSKIALRAKKMSQHCLRVSYQNQIPSRPGCSIGVGLSSLYSHGFFPGPATSAIGINSGDKNVLACRQVARVASALGKASHVLAID